MTTIKSHKQYAIGATESYVLVVNFVYYELMRIVVWFGKNS